MQEKIELQWVYENHWFAPKLQKSQKDLRSVDFVDKPKKMNKKRNFLERFGKSLMARRLHIWVLLWKAKVRHRRILDKHKNID